MNWPGLFLCAAGLFSVAGGVFDWDWFMNSRRAQLMVTLMTRTGARIFYILLGLGITVLGALITFRVIE